MGQLAVGLAKIEVLEQPTTTKIKAGIAFPRYFTARLEAGKTPYDEVQWETRTASIGNDKGSVIFEQRDIEVPVDWSQTATNIVASKYFHGKLGSPGARNQRRPTGAARGRYHRRLGQEGRLLQVRRRTRENFRDELAHLMLTQKACFNSPVWFNVGVKETRGYGWIYDQEAGAVDEAGIGRDCGRNARPASSFR